MQLSDLLGRVNAVLWHDWVLFGVLATGLLFTVWSRFGQARALTHGVAVIGGKYDHASHPGAINHFQALSTALSATVGLGNIAGVAIAISTGGPGALFWMWVTGFVGMALKMTEVTQAMLYRNLDDPRNPHGGAMWVASRGFAEFGPRAARLGRWIAGVFCVTLLVSTFTGGNMFQAWNVADITHEYFGVPALLTGVVEAVLVALVILGGIRRIGQVAGRLVPVMCGLYVLAGLYVIAVRIDEVPGILREVLRCAFQPGEAQGAFLGGVAGWAFLRGMQRALFSNEAGQGSAPIAHSAARTDEPVREGVVAGLEPFVDTICVCTITALVILLSGMWNRPPELVFERPPAVVEVAPQHWSLEPSVLPPAADGRVRAGATVFTVIAAEPDPKRGTELHRLYGVVEQRGSERVVSWESHAGPLRPRAAQAGGIWVEYRGATLTAKAFDSVRPGLGFWLVPAVAWLFALSTMISWSYYGEQGTIYLFGARAVVPYRAVYCLLILVAGSPLIRTEADLDAVSTLGTGLMLCANLPLMLVFGPRAMRAYRSYVGRLRSGAFEPARASQPRTDYQSPSE